MSSVFVLPQSQSVHMMTDSLVYDRNGIVQATNLAKAHSLPTLPAAMSCTGPAFMSPLIAEKIAMEFSSFDEYIDLADEWLPVMFDAMAEKHRDGDAASSFYIIGWHERENRPAYCADLWTDKSSRIERILANSGNREVARAKLIEQTTIAGTPLKPDLVVQCGFRERPNDQYDPELDLLHVTEVARQEHIEGAHWVGGKILLTSIDAKGVTQRVVHHYAEDRVGALIEPEPVSDWRGWRAAREKPAGSWLKRQIAGRSVRKICVPQ